MAPDQLEARALSKSYQKGRDTVPVLQDVDLTLERSEQLAIVGASGSGKSTLLHLLGLIDHPDRGEVRLNGERIDCLPSRRRDQLRNRTFGFIFQTYHLLPELTALENVLLPLSIRYGPIAYLWKLRQFEADAIELLERVGLGHRRTHRPSELSGGEMQRVAIARALMGNPSILLADEPTGNLDANTGEEILRLLRSLNVERELTMIIVTHDPVVANQADRVVRLAEGRLDLFKPAPVNDRLTDYSYSNLLTA